MFLIFISSRGLRNLALGSTLRAHSGAECLGMKEWLGVGCVTELNEANIPTGLSSDEGFSVIKLFC